MVWSSEASKAWDQGMGTYTCQNWHKVWVPREGEWSAWNQFGSQNCNKLTTNIARVKHYIYCDKSHHSHYCICGGLACYIPHIPLCVIKYPIIKMWWTILPQHVHMMLRSLKREGKYLSSYHAASYSINFHYDDCFVLALPLQHNFSCG